MLKKYIICLLIVIFPTACATYGDKKQTPATDKAAQSQLNRNKMTPMNSRTSQSSGFELAAVQRCFASPYQPIAAIQAPQHG